MTRANTKTTNETQIRKIVDDWTKALHAKDVDRLMTDYAPDVVAFELEPPLRYEGDAYRKSFHEWFTTFKGPIGYEIRKTQHYRGRRRRVCHCLNRISGARTNGEQTDVWLRVTVGFRKIDGKWKGMHEHASVPFYMDGSYKAEVDLEP